MQSTGLMLGSLERNALNKIRRHLIRAQGGEEEFPNLKRVELTIKKISKIKKTSKSAAYCGLSVTKFGLIIRIKTRKKMIETMEIFHAHRK